MLANESHLGAGEHDASTQHQGLSGLWPRYPSLQGLLFRRAENQGRQRSSSRFEHLLHGLDLMPPILSPTSNSGL